MNDVDLSILNEIDFKILEHLNKGMLERYIKLFEDYKVVMWKHYESKKEYLYNELPPSNSRYRPSYPDWFISFIENTINFGSSFKELKIYPINRIDKIPSKILAYIMVMGHGEWYDPGYCAEDIERGVFLKLLKRLYDYKLVYDLSIDLTK